MKENMYPTQRSSSVSLSVPGGFVKIHDQLKVNNFSQIHEPMKININGFSELESFVHKNKIFPGLSTLEHFSIITSSAGFREKEIVLDNVEFELSGAAVIPENVRCGENCSVTAGRVSYFQGHITAKLNGAAQKWEK